MKRVLVISLLAVFMIAGQAFSTEMSNAELSTKVAELEKMIGEGAAQNITVSGALEFEFGYEKQDDTTTDFSTATVDLGVEGTVNDYITGSFVFTYNDEDGGIELDEAIIAIDAGNGFYANMGNFAVPFGAYNSRLLSDPLTLEVGETTQNTITAGYTNDMFDVSASLFNGEVNEEGEEDDNIAKYVLAASVNLPSNITVGGSVISDIADSDGIEERVGETVEDFTMGYSVYFSASIMDKIFIDAEYVAAADEFEVDGSKVEPSAYHVELGCAPMENLEAAVRYDAGDDTEVETRYGGVVSYSVLENTTLTAEYVRTEFEADDEDEVDTFTAQLAVEF